MSVNAQTVKAFVGALAAKQPTPGGGAAAAVGASIGAAAASMAATYTQRKKDVESGAAEHAKTLQSQLDLSALLDQAEADAKAYAALQSTWKKDHGYSDAEIEQIQQQALDVPTQLVKSCHTHILQIKDFLQYCNPNITSDAKVGIHQLAGSARAAYQTVMVNSPPVEHKEQLKSLLREITDIENDLL